MNANRKLVVDFRINGKHDHYINKPEDRHVQPHRSNCEGHMNKAKHKKK